MAGKTNIVRDTDLGFAELLKRVEALRGRAYTKVGILADSERGGLHVPGADLTVAEIAAVLEYGTRDGDIPARSFVRSTFDEQRESLAATAARLIAAILFDGMSAEKALNILGLQLATKIKEKIVGGAPIPPPNVPAVALRKARKGKTAGLFKRPAKTVGKALAQAGALAAVRTLVDTGRLVGAISWAVVMGGAQHAANYVGK